MDAILPKDPSEGVFSPGGVVRAGAARLAGALGQPGIEEAIRSVPTFAETVFGRDMEANQIQRYLRSGARAVGELGADIVLDPMMLGLPKAIVGTAGKAVAKGMLGRGARAVPGIRQYAPEVAKALQSAAKAPGAGRAMQRTAGLLGVTPDAKRVGEYIKAGVRPGRAQAIARGERLAAVIDPIRTGAEKGMLAGMGVHMGLAGASGIDEFLRQLTTKGMSPQAFETLMGGLGAATMAGGIGMGLRGRPGLDREVAELDQKVLPAERVPIDVSRSTWSPIRSRSRRSPTPRASRRGS
jgi:hypothetical protein